MKKVIILIVVLSLNVFAQTSNWTGVKETNINVINADPSGVDIFTNGYGNHIIVQESASLNYYKMNVNGVAGTPIPLESESVVSPSITGDASRIYVVYRKNSETNIKTKYSSDGGIIWNDLSPNNPINSNANSIESVFSNNNLHVTFGVSNVIYYSRYNGQSWTIPVPVSTTGQTGYVPRIAAYNFGGSDLLYFMYKKDISDEIKWRKYNVTTNSWGALYSAPISVTNIDFAAGFRVDAVNMVIYFQWHEEFPFQYYFASAVLDLNNNLLHMGNADLSIENYRMYSTQTLDGKTNTVLYFEQLRGKSYSDIGLWRSNSNEDFPTDQFYEYDSSQIEVIKHLNLSSSGNEVYVIWKDNLGSNDGNNLRFKYDDQTPLTPTNFAGTTYNNHPKLTWSLINGPDVVYEIHRKVSPLGGSAGTWQLLTSVSAANASYVDISFEISGQQLEGIVEYKVRAKDLQPVYSAFTNSVLYHYYGVNKFNSGMVREFSLSENYPNPFNPITTISFSIPERSFVTLKVYDMLGREIAELVNEELETGSFEKTFDANNLASGIYIYRITAMKDGKILFNESKQMLLIK